MLQKKFIVEINSKLSIFSPLIFVPKFFCALKKAHYSTLKAIYRLWWKKSVEKVGTFYKQIIAYEY